MQRIELLEVRTGCRLHFGLFELAEGEPLRYGGLGLMLAEPGWCLRFSKSSYVQQTPTIVHELDQGSANDICSRIENVRERAACTLPYSKSIQIEVMQSLPLHSGLGSGTQLAAAVAMGFKVLGQMQQESADEHSIPAHLSIDELLRLSGRGKRSSIGLCGFLNGGFIFDHGLPAGYLDRSDGPRSIHVERKSFDAVWPILLITPPNDALVCGAIESDLISIAAQCRNPNREDMVHQANLAIRHATVDPNFEAFTTSIERFVDHAGALFEPCQGGRFNGDTVQNAVNLARRVGLFGVGQSSWGPTVFGFARDLQYAQLAIEKFNHLRPSDQWTIRICRASNSGASLKWCDS